VGDEHVRVPGFLDEARDLGGLREIDGDGAGALQLAGQRLEHLRAAPGEHEPAPRNVQAPGDGMADAAGGAGEQDGSTPQVHGANTATVAVKPCRNVCPPTGPISPAAKKPAAGTPPSSSATAAASWSGMPNIARPRPLQLKTI